MEAELSKVMGAPVLFTTDQECSLRHITRNAGDVAIVQGYAGTGKTQMLQAAHMAWKESGSHVIGTSITGKAAEGLQKTTGIPSVTVEFLLRRLRPNLSVKDYAQLFAWNAAAAIKSCYYEGIRAGKWMRNPWKQVFIEAARGLASVAKPREQKLPGCKLSAKSILVVDEAAMLPTKTLLALKQECDKAGAKLVLVGDRLQLPPIEAGGPFWSLAKRIGYQSLTTMVRFKQEWMKEALTALIDNEPQRALETFAANDALLLEKHRRAAIERLLVDYGKLKSSELPTAIACVSTNEEAGLVNAGMQRRRIAARQLGFSSLRLANGERVRKHDRVLLTLNDYRYGVRNGLLGTVVAIHRTRGIMGPGSLTIRLDGSKRKGLFARQPPLVTIDLTKYPDVQLGYAATTHKLQGVTVKSNFVLLGEAMLSKEMAYTQLTRGSHQTTIYGTEAQYGDSLTLLARQISKVTQKDLAHDHSLLTQGQGYEQSQSL